MSDIQDDETNSVDGSRSQSSGFELEHGYESNDSDSLDLDNDDDDDDDEGRSYPIGLVGGSLVLHIDQTGSRTVAGNGDIASSSTATSLSDTASENASTRAVMGDTSSATETVGHVPEEDAGDNSSLASMTESADVDRVRRIHNNIFSSLENDLAELVRIREETIQFLESGGGPGTVGDDADSQSEAAREELLNSDSVPSYLRERLTYYSRPFTVATVAQGGGSGDCGGEGRNAGQTPSYKPTAKFDNAPPATPAKPYVEVGLTSCDEKAAAARKILDKLQYGDPEDESACFVRRFWRETSTVVEPPQPAVPASVDVATIAQRTASLQASLEEAFDGLRLRLQQVQGGNGPTNAPQTGESGTVSESNQYSQEDRDMYQTWEEETSILNNPLNYDIWNELEGGNGPGPRITARINVAERRTLAAEQLRQTAHPANSSRTQQRPNTTHVGIGTAEGAELDDDSSDDEEMINYLRVRCTEAINGSSHRLTVLPSSLSEDSRAFFREIGVTEEMGQDLFNMFSLHEDELALPGSLQRGEDEDRGGMTPAEVPQPLFPRDDGQSTTVNYENNISGQGSTAQNNDPIENEAIEDETSAVPQLPLFDDTTPCVNVCPNREDDCSTRVYLDPDYMDFPYLHVDDSHNEEPPSENLDNDAS